LKRSCTYQNFCPKNRSARSYSQKPDYRVVKHWSRLPGEAVAAPSLAAFKDRLDGALSNLV